RTKKGGLASASLWHCNTIVAKDIDKGRIDKLSLTINKHRTFGCRHRSYGNNFPFFYYQGSIRKRGMGIFYNSSIYKSIIPRTFIGDPVYRKANLGPKPC